ncbi:MAG: TlpA family protein disulfide reductase, partial [Bacteroidetes bacterium]|nr:TlpA family protein disulfide reductase [Bacteroidota bacterium]
KIFVGYNNEGLQISFSGDLRKINDFLLKKTKKFNSNDSDWMPRANATHNEQKFDRVIQINDSVTLIHQQFLNENSYELPRWYINFESERLKYLNAEFKLNSLFYREKMLDLADRVQDDFFQNTIGSLQINNKNMLGNARYMFFLMDYMSYKVHSEIESENPSAIRNKNFEIINKELKGIVKDVYITVKLSNEIDRNRHIFDTTSISHVENEKLNEFLKRRYLSNPVLPKRSKLPYFYLMDSSEVYHSSGDFQGKILLINFWATSCKPCIKEFPSENALAEKYKDEPVAVINICMESSVDSWKRIIRKHGLKTVNLYSQGNWDKKLTKNFDINGWPHSVLVDWNGNIVQNKCPRASKNVDKLIDQLLLEMNESNDQ